MSSTAAHNDFEILTGTHAWSATPDNYSSMRFLTFKPDGRGEATYGYGQTIYAKVGYEFELSGDSALRLKYLSSPAFAAFRGFEPSRDTAEKLIPYTLVRGEYRGVESIVASSFDCEWLLTLGDSPWPVGMTFPYDVPTSFYGYRRNEPREPK
jgi:hypothetical protein